MVDPYALALELSPATRLDEPSDAGTFLADFTEWIRDVSGQGVLTIPFGELRRLALLWVAAHAGEYADPILKAVDLDERDDVYRRYHDAVNMTESELRAWSEDPCSREASLSRAPIERNLRLLGKPHKDWDERDVRDAKRTISFVARMSQGEQGEPVSEDCPLSRRDISLLNWAYDPR